MTQEEWSKQLEQQLDGYEEQPSRALWAGIEARLATPQAQQPAKHPAVAVPLWRRLTTAAAIAALVVGGGLVLWEQSIHETSEAVMAQASDEIIPVEEQEHGHSLPTVPKASPETPSGKPANIAARAEPVGRQTPTGLVADNLVSSTASVEEEVATDRYESQAQEKRPTAKEQNAISQPQRHRRSTLSQFSGHRRLTLSLYASAGMNDYRSQNPVQMAPSKAQQFAVDGYAGARMAHPIFLTGYEERQEHHQPIELGLTSIYALSRRLSLSTGVVYTQLRSDFTTITPTMQTESQQHHHYVGIPLNVQLRIGQLDKLNIYVGGGVEALWNMKATLTTNGVEQEARRDRWQWSAGGSLGVQYDVLPSLGLYAEPGLRHYFDNGSSVTNYFKDKPTSFNLQMGLRLKL